MENESGNIHGIATGNDDILNIPQTQPETNNINELNENNSLDIGLFLSISDKNDGKIRIFQKIIRVA